MKTIADLNNKWWYRLVKVLYIFFVIFCYVVIMTTSTLGLYSLINENKDNYSERIEQNNKKMEEAKERMVLIYDLKSKGYSSKDILESIDRAYNPFSRFNSKYNISNSRLELSQDEFDAIYGTSSFRVLSVVNSYSNETIKSEFPSSLSLGYLFQFHYLPL
jgi:hypothetical protein